MSEQVIEDIAEKLIDKINFTGKYKQTFGRMDKEEDSCKTIAKVFGVLFGELWKNNGNRVSQANELVMGEKVEKDEVIEDATIISQLKDIIQSDLRETLLLITPILAVTCNIEKELPYELKLILLADAFNAVAHNLEKLLDYKKGQGKDFWFGLKNKVLVEMISILDKNSIYITDETRHENRIAIYFKAKLGEETKFFAWHSDSELLQKIPGYIKGDYTNEQLRQEMIELLVPSDKKNNLKYGTDLDEVIKIENQDIYSGILRQHNDFKKPIEELFSVELKEKDSTLVYEGSGSYETKEEIEDKVSKLLEEMKNVDTQEELEELIKNSDYADKIHDIKILKLRGRYPIYYAELNINGKTAVIECKKGFTCKKREDKCYTKDDITQIQTSTVEEIAEMLETEQLIKAKDIDDYIKKQFEKFAEVIKGMTVEQKIIIIRAILCSSSEKEIGEIIKELFEDGNRGKNENRNGGFGHE